MAHFRGTVQGDRGQGSRLGSKRNGLNVTCNGWNAGISVQGFYDPESGKDYFSIYATRGSNGFGSSFLIGTVMENDNDVVFQKV